MEEYISVNEYMRRFKIGHKNVLNLIATNQVEYQITETGRYRIKVGSNTVNIQMYEKAIERATIAETKLEMIKKILLDTREENGYWEFMERIKKIWNN